MYGSTNALKYTFYYIIFTKRIKLIPKPIKFNKKIQKYPSTDQEFHN